MNNIFEKTDWEKQDKATEQVLNSVNNWDAPKITNISNMFQNARIVDEKIITQMPIIAKGLINEFLKLK